MAPLSGYTDLPWRRSMRRHGCRYAFTEMIDAASLRYARERASAMLLRGEEEDFFGIQLLGSDPEFLKVSLEVLNEYDCSVLDFNLGCPVPKVTKKCAGAELGRHIDLALERFSLFRQYSRHRLSAKIRILSEEDPAPTLELAQGLAELGAEAITVHGRVKDKIYSGPVYFAMIRHLVEHLPVPVIGNGGIFTAADAAEMYRETGCHGIMLARGAMGNPWLFAELADPEGFLPPTVEELCAEVEQHIGEMVELYGEPGAIKLSRKMLHDYFKGRGFPGVFRAQASHLADFAAVKGFLAEAKRLRSGPVPCCRS